MTPVHGNSDAALRAALTAVLEESADVEREVAHLSARLAHLREAASGLAGLLGPQAAKEVADGAGIKLRATAPQLRSRVLEEQRRARGERLTAPTTPDQIAKREHLVAARREMNQRNQVRRSDPRAQMGLGAAEDDVPMAEATSTDKVVELLREFDGRAIPRQLIVDEFARRGWVDPGWKEPEAAIRMAIKRAVDRGEAAPVAGGRYMHKTPDLFQGGDGEGGEA